MSEITNEIKAIEVHLKDALEKVALGECLARLQKNRDFKKLITQRYFKEEPARLVMLKACPGAQTDEIQKEVENDMIAVGGLFQFFCAVEGEARSMQHAIEADKQMLEALESEEDE